MTLMRDQWRSRSRLIAVLWGSLVFAQSDLTLARANPGGSTNSLTNAVDLRPLFDEWGLERSLQRNRPTCSTFTVVGALEFAAAKRQNHGTRLSVEFLNWAANQVCGEAADGGFFSDLWKGFARFGICGQGDMLYRDMFEPNQAPTPEAMADAKTRLGLGLRQNWIKEWDVKTGLTPAQLDAIKATLSNGWPVCGGFRWPKEERWENSVLQMCPPEKVRDGHSVLLVGYRDQAGQPGDGVFIFRNTSNEGRDGLMPYSYALQYMNDALWADFEPRRLTGAAATGSSATEASRPAPRVAINLAEGPLGALTVLSKTRNRRYSSNELPAWQDANLDMTLLPPGKAVEVPLMEGPGMITHLWFTSHAGRVNELDSLTLRIYWDGRREPGVEVPLGTFFAVGQGRPAPVESVPVQVSPAGALTCFWRMPFERSARMVISNDNPARTAGLYWQVDWVEMEALSEDTPYFHARYRQEYPARAGSDYVIADLEGNGSYVGTVMSVTLGQDGWWGEGDDFFYIDGEAVPSLQGTGAEDYFNDAWGFRPRSGNWFGQPRWQGDNAGDSGVCYRWHVPDPVRFTRSLKVTIEHKGNRVEDTEGFYLERPDFINSVAFWYQTGEPKTSERLPPYPERRVPWSQYNLVSAFRQATSTSAAAATVQFAGMFGARPVLAWTNREAGARLSIPFTVSDEGRYAARLTAVVGPEYGLYAVEMDGKTVLARVSFSAMDYDELDLALGTYQLGPGKHEIAFRALPVESDSARPLAVEMLRLLKLPPQATRAVKTRHEAHFIRLGIGRAVYAYRLAYGELPESLAKLVGAGLLEPRYLADENHIPLKSRREGDYLVVESSGKEAWTYRWKGLDARR